MKKKSKLLLSGGLILTFAGVVLGATLLTWTRTITWNIPGVKGFDVYATTGSGSSWTKGNEMPSTGSVDISNVTNWPWTESYWLENQGNVPIQVQMNGQQQQGASIQWTLEYDSVVNSSNPTIGTTWTGQQGWGVNLQIGEHIVFTLSINAVGQGSYSCTFYGS
jgi:hypothetical protein